ncbi:MAG: FliA/WhiG family RNA polymerase sigma factor [bacterium]|jgi:RNA polymerase sigma factor for flagellar operon FliA|nr:MAG: FliA/WhiG family RNA polymerase sigma factor [bacterium]
MTREPIGMNVGALRGVSEEGRAMAVRPGAAPRRAGAVVAADGADDAELWLAYRRTGDPAIRNRLLSRNLGLVYHVARRMIRTLSTDVELDELISSGSMGLLNAVESYDPDRGVAFSTYAAQRIRGAILDDLRSRDPVSRAARQKLRALETARESLTEALARPPADHELAERLGITVEELWRWQAAATEPVHVPLDEPLPDGDTETALRAELVPDEEGEDIETTLDRDQELDLVRDEILRLPERERVVLSLYYFEELKLHEIGRLLGLTESRVSQIRSKALETLRRRLHHLREVSR